MSLPRQASIFDEHRNSSRVFPVTHEDAENARRALARFHAEYPELAQWIIDGHPLLTEDEHVRRFGGPYSGVKARRR